MIEVLDTESIYNGTSKRRKVKHPMSRRTLRQRKIHSLKRQIQIKEKMLEVGFLYTSRLHNTMGTKVIRIQNEILSKWSNPQYF